MSHAILLPAMCAETESPAKYLSGTVVSVIEAFAPIAFPKVRSQ